MFARRPGFLKEAELETTRSAQWIFNPHFSYPFSCGALHPICSRFRPRVFYAVYPGMHRFPLFFGLLLLIGTGPAHSGVAVEGLGDCTTVSGQAIFRIVEDAPGEWAARLDDAPVATGNWIEESTPGYHELRLQPIATGSSETPILVRFVVRDPARGSSETGLAPWTPPPPIPAHPEALAALRLDLIAPRAAPAGALIPLTGFLRSETTARAPFHASIFLQGGGPEPLWLRRGAGGLLLPISDDSADILLQPLFPGSAAPLSIRVEPAPTWTDAPARIESRTVWPPRSRIRLSENLEIPAGSSLTIGSGSWIALAPEVDLTVSGALLIEGTIDDPIVFAPAEPGSPWGGAVIQGSQASVTARGTFFTGGGAGASWFSGSGFSAHRSEQALFLFAGAATGAFEDCWFIRNPGQILHGQEAEITLHRCLVQGAPTVGQFNGGAVRVADSAFIAIPEVSSQFSDADNDGIYFTTGNHELTRSLIAWAKDDGVDAGSGNSGSVTVTDCWVESCFHEGFAWSGEGRTVSIDRSVVLHCGQGIETGFGEPNVTVARSLTAGNLVGLRFGDNYDWDYNGFLRVRDSFSLYNQRDVWGRDWDSWEENLDHMDLQANVFTNADPLHPQNHDWEATTQGDALLSFTPEASGPVGLGFAEFAAFRARSSFGEPLRIGLSGFSSIPVRAAWTAVGKLAPGYPPGQILGGGEIEFPPGKTLVTLNLSSIATPTPFVAVVLTTATGAAVTGQSAIYYGAFPESQPPESLVSLESTWAFLDGGAVPAPSWTSPEFDDSSWKSGQGELGFGDDDENTAIDGGPSGGRYPVCYFRRRFEVEDPVRFSVLLFRLRRDDGAFVYLNGREIFRSNLPGGPIGPESWALDNTGDENALREELLDPRDLQPGENVIAVSIHQSDPDSSDLSFDLELTAMIQEPAVQRFDRSAGLEAFLWNLGNAESVLEHAASLDGPWKLLPLPSSPAVILPLRGLLRAGGSEIPYGDGSTGFLRPAALRNDL